MRRLGVLARALPLLLATLARGGDAVSSPEDMAEEVRRLVSSGAGALMPDLDRAYIADGGLVPLGEGDFPAMFLHGLVAEWRDGVAGFPVEVRLDDATGDAYFLDALGEPFWYIPSEVPERYRPWLVANPWFAPSRAGIRWTFVHDADAAFLRAASAPAGRRAAPLRSIPPPPVTNLCFTGFSYTGTSVWFSAAWPASALPLPGNTLDVYAKTNLLDAHWFPLAGLPVAPAATNATLEIAGEDIPGFFVPPHVHDASCPAVTNITFDLVSNEPVTGIVYRCYRYQAISSGFLRLGTREDTDGDGLTDAYERLVLGSDPFDALDAYADPDGDGLPNVYEFVHGTDPFVSDWNTALKSSVGGVCSRYRTLKEAFQNCTPYEILVVEPGVRSGPDWTDLEAPAHPFLLSSPDGGRLRGVVLKAGSGLSVLRIPSGAGRHVVIQGVAVNLASSASWQAAFFWGGFDPYSGEGAGGCFRNVEIRFGPGSGTAIGWQFRHFSAEPVLLSGCVANAEGRTNARGVYAIDSPPIFLENCSFREFPDANAGPGYAIQLESTVSNPSSAPAEIPVSIRGCLFDASFTNALVLAPLTNGVRYAMDMDRCLIPSPVEYPADETVGTVVAPVSISPHGHLPANTPAAGAGPELRFSPVDIDGELRGTSPCIGADEWSDGLAVDSDGDGLSNQDEMLVLGTDPFDPDTDGDTVPDGTEISEGIDPLERNNVCFFLSGRLDSGLTGTNRVVLAIASGDSRPLRLLASVRPSAPPAFSFVFPHVALTNEPAPRLCLFVDTDGDGLPGDGESAEFVPLVLSGHETVVRPVFRNISDDGDGDGIPDIWELDHGLCSTNALDGSSDPDGDGLVNLHEYWHDYDPWVADGSNTVLSILARSIDDRIAGKNPQTDLCLYSNYVQNAKQGIFVRNPSCWASGIDLSCASPWNTGDFGNWCAGTLISPRHFLMAAHFRGPKMQYWKFRDSDGNVFSRRFISFVTITNSPALNAMASELGSEAGTNTDLCVCLLDSALPPSIKPAKFLPENHGQWTGSGRGLPVLILDQEEKAIVGEIRRLAQFWAREGVLSVFRSPTALLRSQFYEQIIRHDSGNPAFLVWNDDVVLLGCLWHGGPIDVPFCTFYLDDIQAAMNELCPGYSVQVLNMDEFPTIEGGPTP